jgi:plasmid stabilization system protein ParE
MRRATGCFAEVNIRCRPTIRRAIADIDGLAAWVAKDSPQGARSVVVEKILKTIERVNLFPEMGHEGREERTYERGVSDTPYIVVYEVRKKPSAVLVIAMLHGSRNR